MKFDYFSFYYRTVWVPFVLITIGVLLLVEEVGLFKDALARWWPLTLVVIGVVKILCVFYE